MDRDFHDFHRGEVYYADLGPARGSVQGGYRPVLIFQNEVGNYFSPTVLVVPTTSNCNKKPDQPTHVVLDDVDGLRPSLFMAEQVTTVDKTFLGRYVGKLTEEQKSLIDEALYISAGLTQPEDRIPFTVEAP